MGQAWNIWMHPRRTVGEMQELQDIAAEQAEQLARAEESLNAQRCAADRTAEELSAAIEQREKSDASVMELTRLLLAVRKELDDTKLKLKERDRILVEKERQLAEAEELDRAMEQFEQALGQAEEMKANYEARIARLRERIVELNSRLAAVQNPAKENTADGKLPTAGKITPPDSILFGDPDADWLQPLP